MGSGAPSRWRTSGSSGAKSNGPRALAIPVIIVAAGAALDPAAARRMGFLSAAQASARGCRKRPGTRGRFRARPCGRQPGRRTREILMDSTTTLVRTVHALTRVIDAADPHARGRSLRIARYAVRIARELDTPAAELTDIELGALLHDIGRHAILNDVVQTPRALDASERA